MVYFSYNDYIDYTNNKKINEIMKVEEKRVKYEITKCNKLYEYSQIQLMKLLKEKHEVKNFLKAFYNLSNIVDDEFIRCNEVKISVDNKLENNVLYKVKNKEMYIFLKVVSEIDYNISFKMLQYSIKIIENWSKQENMKNVRYPIVFPIVLYIGSDKWNFNNNKKIRYTTYEHNRVNLYYNIIDINQLCVNSLKITESKLLKYITTLRN